MKKLLTVLCVLLFFYSNAQPPSGRATGNILISGFENNYVDTVYFNNDTLYFIGVNRGFSDYITGLANHTVDNIFQERVTALNGLYVDASSGIYLDADSLMFIDVYGSYSLNRLSQLGAAGSGDGYVSLASFNMGTGVITLNDPINGAKTVDIDGRFGQLLSNNTWEGVNVFETSSSMYTRIDGSAVSVYGTNPLIRMGSAPGSVRSSWTDYSSFADFYTTTYWRLRTDGGREITVKDDGIYGNLDAATTADVIYYNSVTDEFTYGTAPTGGSVNYGSQYQIPFINTLGTGFDYISDFVYNSASNDLYVGSGGQISGGSFICLNEYTSIGSGSTGGVYWVKTNDRPYFTNQNYKAHDLTNASGYAVSADEGVKTNGYVVWQSDGTGSGDNGDIMIKINDGTTTKVITLVDFSAF